MMSEKVKKLTVMDIFAPVLKFDGQFCSKKFYVGIFELPYWKSLYVRHFLDVMHIEKNIFDNLFGTLLNVRGMSKDSVKSRLDMEAMGIRKELAPVQRGSCTYLPPAAYSLSRKEKKLFFEFLDGIKVPEGYSSNVQSLVSIKDLKLKNLKSHDCHVLLQNFLPIGIRNILPNRLRGTITKLCLFFKAICSKVVDTSMLNCNILKNLIQD